MKLTLAPIPFYWPANTVKEFYRQACSWPVDTVVLGETICSKRRELNLQDWLAIAEQLKQAGKQVRLSSLALIESSAEFNAIKQLLDKPFTLEANDLGAANLFQEHDLPFHGGHFLNIYNLQTLALLKKDGLVSWTLPVELGKHELKSFQQGIQAQQLELETEVFAHGFLPLALSARCFTARALDRPKDECKKVCIDYPQGIAVDSQDGQRLFTLNGIQTLSGKIIDLADQVDDMAELGVSSCRLSPSCVDFEATVQRFASAVNKTDALQHSDTEHSNTNFCNGYWFGREGMIHVENAIYELGD